MATCNWSGYQFTVYTMDGTTWNDVGGVYIFAGLTQGGRWNAYYIGICESFSDRCPNHERWAEAVRLGATHVHALVVPLEADRQSIERELIRAWAPPLNIQNK